MLSCEELRMEIMDIQEKRALDEFRERVLNSKHTLAELKNSSSKHDFRLAISSL